VVLVRGTTSAPLFANRSCHLLTTDETGVHTSAGYALERFHLKPELR